MTPLQGRRIVVAGAVTVIVIAAIVSFIFSMNDRTNDAQGDKESWLLYEAEDGVLDGTVAQTNGSGYSGKGYVTDFTDDEDAVTLQMDSIDEGLYLAVIGYRAANGEKVAELLLNGEPSGNAPFAPSSGFAEAPIGKLYLKSGTNTITVKRGWGYYDIDYIKLKPTKVAAPHKVSAELVNPKATEEAKELMRYLADNFGTSIISGQQQFDNIPWIENVTGKRPAIIGFDLIEYSPSRAENGSKSYDIDISLTWHRMGGIVSFLWHWNAPTGLINEPGKEWWRGFYTDSVTFDLEAALRDKESEEYKLLLRDIDVIAGQLKILSMNKVPVLFRPLHEAEGGWFWWGAKGAEPAKELYRILYDRLVYKHELNNLIWVWNSVAPEWYPGDDVVDIVSYDSYPTPGDHSAIIHKYDQLVELTGGTKLIAMMENGSIPDPDAMAQYGAYWGLFITWTDEFLTDGQHNSEEFLKRVYNHPSVITLEDLPAYKERQKQKADAEAAKGKAGD